ncbi:MAG: hypothetical protein R3F11_27865 [Verrucomicrobiales bacterium]
MALPSRALAACAGVLGSALLLLVLYLTSPAANLYFFENFIGKIFSFLLVSAFTFCLLKWIQPRVPPIRERQPVYPRAHRRYARWRC